MVFRKNVDPVSLLDLGELKQVFARANHFMPKQRPGEYEFQYKKRLAQVSPPHNTRYLVLHTVKLQVYIFFIFSWWRQRYPWKNPKTKEHHLLTRL